MGQSYVDAFPELAAITSEYTDLSVDRVRRILRAEARRAGGQIVAGLKLPSGAVALWGLPAMTIVLVYFLVHLRVLAADAVRSSPKEVVAWIGAYATFDARLVTVCSAVLLPLATGLFLWREAWQMALPTAMLALLVASTVLSILCVALIPFSLRVAWSAMMPASRGPAEVGESNTSSERRFTNILQRIDRTSGEE